MSSIAIIGAGHSGLQLAFALLRDGQEVTVYSDRTPQEMLTGRLPSSNALFARGLQRERELGVCFWDGEQPLIDQTFVRVTDPEGNVAIAFDGRFKEHAQSVDQRLKFSVWLQAFEDRGGKVVYGSVDVDALEAIASANDLTVVSAGKGDISRLFEVDETRRTYDRPQRSIGMCAVVGAKHDSPDGVYYNIRPGIGEAFGIPMVTAAGPAICWVMEAIPGGPMDRWAEATDAASMLELTKRTFADFFPWESERIADASMADDNAWLCGAVPPLVRKPVATLPSGQIVMGMGDVTVLNDPCTGQGANTASACADVVYDAIRANINGRFDADWMNETFETFWDYAQWPVAFTNAMLAAPPEHVLQLLGTATQVPDVANRFTNGFTYPEDLGNFMFDPESCRLYIAEASQQAAYRARGRSTVGAA